MSYRTFLEKGINRKRLLATFVDLIRINSPTFEEGELGVYLVKKLRQTGCPVVVQDYGKSFNIIASKKGNSRMKLPLLLNAHMDTIEPTTGIRFEKRNGIIRSVGDTVLGADDKSALAQILEALRVMQERNISHSPLEIVFTSAEEKGLWGAKYLDYAKLKGRHALVLDSSGPVGRIVIAAPSHYTYRMQVHGRSAHAGIEPEKGINAIRTASEIIAQMPDGRIDPYTTANTGMISGGSATNVVPKEVIIHGEVRSHHPDTLKELRKRIAGKAREAAGKRKGRVSLTWTEEYQSFRIRDDDPFLCFMDGVFRACGIRPVHTVTGGGSDASIFHQKGIAAINISTGMKKVHSTHEQISLEDLGNGCLVLLMAISRFGDFCRNGDPLTRDKII